MSSLLDRVTRQYMASAGMGLVGLQHDNRIIPERLRPAAVLIAITDRTEPGIILTHRPDTMPSHPGQVAFPGGKLEPGEDAITAALREADEELSIDPRQVQVIGATENFSTGSGYSLTPVIGLVPHDLQITPDPREVADWFEAPLRFVLDQRNHQEKIGLFAGTRRSYTEIIWEGHRIWGITAGILSNLSHRLAWQDLLD